MMVWALIFLISLSTTAQSLQCYPPYQTCNTGTSACSIFPEWCSECKANELVCPDGKTCVEDYSNCPLLPFQDQRLSVEDRIQQLLSILTLEEKVNQLNFEAPAILRLGIPSYDWGHEALHGVAREIGPDTSYPQVIGLGATFDSDLIYRIGRAISAEARAKYSLAVSNGDLTSGITFYAPNINIYRDPRWGRGHETPGEDPYLSSVYATNIVKGIQGYNGVYYQATACCKHFAAYNLENQTDIGIDRHNFDPTISLRDMYETYLPAFKACVMEGQAQTVMCSYNSINGTPACANYDLLTKTLRQDWKFDGFVVSDEGAIQDIFSPHNYSHTTQQAAIDAITAGCDSELMDVNRGYYSSLIDSVKNGSINVDIINKAVGNIFRIRMRLGLLDNPWLVPFNYIPYSVVDSPAHRQLALEAARKSIVLLKNNNNVLPLSKSLKNVAIIGPNANVTDILLGNYAGNPTFTISILSGIQEKLPYTTVNFAPGCSEQWCTDKSGFNDSVSIAEKADAVIMVMGIRSCPYDQVCWLGRAEIEGEQKDRTSIDLPGYQYDLIKEISALGKPTILVLVNGGSLTFDDSPVNAVLEAFYPGEQGGTAVADVLFGDYNPAGRLSTTWVKNINQLPAYTDMSMTGRTYRYWNQDISNVQYSFGFGLSYTKFVYSLLAVKHQDLQPCVSQEVLITVTNIGNMTGDEVVQIYFSIHVAGNDNTPKISLVAFQRISQIVPYLGDSLTFNVRPEQIAYFSEELGELVIGPGTVDVYAGGGQPQFTETLHTKFNIVGKVTPLSSCN